jgi:mRNA interferase MazF
VVQTDQLDDPRIRSFLVVPLTSRLHLEGLSGNVRLERRDTGLSKSSVANVFDVQKVFRGDFEDRVSRLPPELMEAIDEGLRLVFDL